MLLRRLALFTVALSLFTPFALAQSVPTNVAAPRSITVTGEGEVRVPPDYLQLSFTIAVNDKDIDKTRAQVDDRTKKLLALIKQQGVEAKDTQTAYLNIEPRYQNKLAGGTEFLGYFATRRVSVTVRDLNKFESLIAEALRQGVTGVDQGEFHTSQLRQYRDQARSLASKAALEKAKAIAGDLGGTVGKPLSIVENTSGSPTPARYQTQNATSDAGGGDDSDSLALGQLSVRARITVTFSLE